MQKEKKRIKTHSPKKGKVIIFSAPSGSGKTTIVKKLLLLHKNLGFSISACTRSQRKNEIHGKDYYFLTKEEFQTKIKDSDFVEWEQVYENSFYGTLKSEIEQIWTEGKHVLFDVDVQGGLKLKEYFQEQALAIFITVPSLDILEQRLRNRNTDSEESISKRIAKFKEEIKFEHKFDQTIINKNLDTAIQEIQKIIQKFVDS